MASAFSYMKLPVSDFERTEEFYGRLFGMEMGPELEGVKVERDLRFPGPQNGARIMMVNQSMRFDAREMARSAAGEVGEQEASGASNPLIVDLMAGRTPFTLGSSWTVFHVDDIEKAAAVLDEFGQPNDIFDVSSGYEMKVIVTTDPDGNIVEIVQAL